MITSHNAFSFKVSSIIRINGKLMSSAMLGALSLWLWPDHYQSWPSGLASVCMGFGSASALVSALKDMFHLFQRERAIAAFDAIGGDPKTAELVSTERLIQAGMVEP